MSRASQARSEENTQCVADSIQSDGEFRCLSVCVIPENAGEIFCVDDGGCCDPNAACTDEGSCLEPDGDSGGDGSGGSNPSADGSGCDIDRDDDGVINVLDANPDQSCSADSDNDGLRDSCDANDSDGGCFGCGVPRLRRTGLLWAYVIALFAARRRRPWTQR